MNESDEKNHNRSKLATIAAVHIALFIQLTGISVLNVYCGPIAQKKAQG